MSDTFTFNSNPINEFAIDGDQPTGQLEVVAGRAVEFVGTSNGTSEGSLFIWDFGDLNGSTIDNPNILKTLDVINPVVHYYSIVGKYVVRLIEQRKDGIILEAVKTIKIFA